LLRKRKSTHQSEKPRVALVQKVRNYVFSEEPVEIEVGYTGQELKPNLGVAFTSLALTSAGVLFYPPLTIAGVGLILYLNVVYFVKDFPRYIFKERRIGPVIIDKINFYGALFIMDFFAASLLISLYYSNRTILWHTEDQASFQKLDQCVRRTATFALGTL